MIRVFNWVGGGGYELVHPTADEAWEIFTHKLGGRRLADHWAPPTVKLIREDEGRPLQESDSPWLGLSTFVFRARAVLALGPLLQQHGEPLPLSCPDARLVVFNPLHVLDALDEQQARLTTIPGGKVVGVERHVFRREVVANHPLFRITTLRASPTYVTEEFVEQWHAAGLKGLRFDEIWRG